jgi:hypothetical protein
LGRAEKGRETVSERTKGRFWVRLKKHGFTKRIDEAWIDVSKNSKKDGQRVYLHQDSPLLHLKTKIYPTSKTVTRKL